MTDWPETDALLERFRTWLGQVREESQTVATNPSPAAAADGAAEGAAERGMGLVDLVREFTALRHEVKLQTKSARGLEEQTAAAVAAMEEASRQFRAVEPKEAEAARRAALPLIESMADLDEALGRAQAVVESARERLGAIGRPLFSGSSPTCMRPSPLGNAGSAAPGMPRARDLCQADADDRKRIVDALAEAMPWSANGCSGRWPKKVCIAWPALACRSIRTP